MLTLILKDWTGLVTSKTNMQESELGYTGDLEHLKKFAQRVACDKTGSLTIEQNGQMLVSASYLNEIL